MLLRDGRPLEALYHVRSAARLQPRQSFGTRQDRVRFDRTTRAEYLNQMAVLYYEMGWLDLAVEAAGQAHADDGSIPEIAYDLAVLKLARALARPNASARQIERAVAQSRRLLFSAALADPDFHDVAALGGALDALSGDCERGVPIMQAALSPPPGVRSRPSRARPRPAWWRARRPQARARRRRRRSGTPPRSRCGCR